MTLTIISELAEKDLDKHTFSRAIEVLSRIVLPKEITGEMIERYFRKALRTGAWSSLPQESRALIYILRRWKGRIKSHTLKSILKNIFLKIELSTFRGKALLYGIIQAMKNPIYKLGELLQNTKRILTLGIFYLNNSLTYRIYG